MSSTGYTNNNRGNENLFTGREYDAETGLYYYRARIYSPSFGRFLNRDPIWMADQVNLYTYVRNSPVMGRDPSGEFIFFVIGAIEVIGWTITAVETYEYVHNYDSLSDTEKVNGAEDIGISVASVVISPLAILRVAKWGALGMYERMTAKGYSSFPKLKRNLPELLEWWDYHHIVGQNPSNLEKFWARAIHSPDNVIALPRSIHQDISAYYSSIDEMNVSRTQRVRDELKNWSFEEQYRFGIDVLNRYWYFK